MWPPPQRVRCGQLWTGAPWPSFWPRLSMCTRDCSVYVCAYPCDHSVCRMVFQLPLTSSRLTDTGSSKDSLRWPKVLSAQHRVSLSRETFSFPPSLRHNTWLVSQGCPSLILSDQVPAHPPLSSHPPTRFVCLISVLC